MPRVVASPRDAVTQRVGCLLPVSPAGAVLCGGLSSWPSLLVPNWSLSPGPGQISPRLGETHNRQSLDELEWALNLLRYRATRRDAKRRGISCGIQFFCITPILAFFNVFGRLSRHLSRLDNHPKTFHHNEGSG